MIDGEHVGKVLRTLGPKLAILETANESVGLSMATDSCQIGQVCGRRAYPTVVRVVFVLSASDRCFAPVGPTAF